MKTAFNSKSKFLSAAVAALFTVTAYSAFADNTVKAGGPYDKPGRALDEGTVTSRGASSVPGRTLDEDVVKSGSKRTHARAIDDVKTGGKSTETQGRTLDENRKVKKGKKTTADAGRAVDEATVRSQGISDKPSRALKKE